MVLVTIGAIVLGTSLGLVWWWHGVQSEQRGEFLVCWCDKCGQKVRYASHKAGRPGGCPHCKNRWVLPEVSQVLCAVPVRQRVGAIRHRRAG